MSEEKFITLDEANLMFARLEAKMLNYIWDVKSDVKLNKQKIGAIERAIERIEELFTSQNQMQKAQLVTIILGIGVIILTKIL